MPQWIGLLENSDIKQNNKIYMDDGHPVKKAILLLFMPTCPHCQHPKKVLTKMDLRKYGIHKLAIDVSRQNDPLVSRVPQLFGFSESEFTVPQVWTVRDGRIAQKLKSIDEFDPIRLFPPVIQKIQASPAKPVKRVRTVKTPARMPRKSVAKPVRKSRRNR